MCRSGHAVLCASLRPCPGQVREGGLAGKNRIQTLEGSTISDSSLFEMGLKIRKEVLGEDYVNKSITGATHSRGRWRNGRLSFAGAHYGLGRDSTDCTCSIGNLAMVGALNRLMN